jgi:transposase
MTASLVPDDLWEATELLLREEPPKPKGGRPRVPDRTALAGIVFVLRTDCRWRLLPKGLGCGSGTTCWRRLREWQEAGIWQRLHEALLNWLGDTAAIDWARASVDSLSVRAKKGRVHRAQSRRSRKTRIEVPPGRRPERHPTGRQALGHQCSRQHPVADPDRRDSFDHRPTLEAGPAAQAPGQAVCRQSVRVLSPAPFAPHARHHPADCATGS